MPAPDCLVTVGVDSHGDVHLAAAVDQLGRLLATTTVPTTTRGYRQLLNWARRLGQVERFGVEGTGAFAAGLLRFLHANGQVVLDDVPPILRRRAGGAPGRARSTPTRHTTAARTERTCGVVGSGRESSGAGWNRRCGLGATAGGSSGRCRGRAASGACRCGGTATRDGGLRSCCWPVRSSASTGSNRPQRPTTSCVNAPSRGALRPLETWAATDSARAA
jgi:hypothetical protein